MNSFLKAIQQFHQKYSEYLQEKPNANLPADIHQFRIELMTEELKELVEAMDEKDIAHISKELADVMYAVLGTVETYGLSEKFDVIFNAVHQSNMSKDVVKSGKAIKGKKYFKAEEKIKNILKSK